MNKDYDHDGWCEKAAEYGGNSGIALTAFDILEYKIRRLAELGANFSVSYNPSSGWFIKVEAKS